jgi:hypothetical protein
MEYQDKKIMCKFANCKEFIFSVKDQEFFAEHKYNDPTYCQYHRQVRREDKLRKEAEMGKQPLEGFDFNKI